LVADVTEPNLLEIDDELRRDSAICKRGVETDFWQLIKKIGADLQADAHRVWVTTDPTAVGQIAELQAISKVVDKFISKVEETATLT